MKNKKVLIIITAAALLIAGALIITLTSLNRIVAAAIERYGSLVTQTKVAVSSVDIKLSAGEGAVSGLTVGNPSGFSGPAVFQLGSISIKIDTGSITKDMVVIDNVAISGPYIMYEINAAGKSNINIIKQNVQEFQEQSASGKKGGPKKDTANSVKLLIRKLIIDNGKIDVRVAALDRPLSVPLPRIVLSDIGGKEGASPGEVGAQILSAITREAGSAASGLGIDKYVGKTIDEIRKGISKGGDALKDAGKAFKKIFGQ